PILRLDQPLEQWPGLRELVLPKEAIARQVGGIGRQLALGSFLELSKEDPCRLSKLLALVLYPAQLVVQLLAQPGISRFFQPGRIRLGRLRQLPGALVKRPDAEPTLGGERTVG